MSRSGSPSAVRALGDRPASRTLEKGAVLSLSLLLTSTYSVSTVIPSMVSYYQGYGRGQIEQLISVTSVAIMVVILLNPWISRIISQRVSIVSGLLLLSAGGCLPVFTKAYGAVFAGRLVLGVGIGLVNVYAVDMINSRFEGEERSTLLGYRGSAEIVGNTALTLVVGQILGAGLDWRYCFLIYLSGLLVLVSYLLFVPKAPGKNGNSAGDALTGKSVNPTGGVLTGKSVSSAGDALPGKSGPAEAERAQKASDWRRHAWGFLSCALHGAMFIGINTCTTMRIPSLVLERGMGTEAQSSLITSLMLAAGIGAGILFGRLARILRGMMQKFWLVVFGAGMGVMALAGNLWILGIGAVVTGFAFSILIVTVFEQIPGRFPPGVTTMATTWTLVGCNMGSGFSSWALRLIDLAGGGMGTSFGVFAVLMVFLGLVKRPGKAR